MSEIIVTISIRFNEKKIMIKSAKTFDRTILLQRNPHLLKLQGNLMELLTEFRAPIRFCIAYGSGVFPQTDLKKSDLQKKDDKCVDLIFGVTHSQHWHSININQYPHHYSFLRNFGSGVIDKIQNNFGANIYYNPLIDLKGIKIKYGVISIDKLYRDLMEWNNFYMAGRFQKPILLLRNDARIDLANFNNLSNIIRLAVLYINKPRIHKSELFLTITAFSYKGDFRMKIPFGENPNKISNILKFNLNNFEIYYKNIINQLEFIKENPQDSNYYDINLNENQLKIILSQLPIKLNPSNLSNNNIDQILSKIILKSSLTQSLKGILTAGFQKSFVYVMNKMKKSIL